MGVLTAVQTPVNGGTATVTLKGASYVRSSMQSFGGSSRAGSKAQTKMKSSSVASRNNVTGSYIGVMTDAPPSIKGSFASAANTATQKSYRNNFASHKNHSIASGKDLKIPSQTLRQGVTNLQKKDSESNYNAASSKKQTNKPSTIQKNAQS